MTQFFEYSLVRYFNQSNYAFTGNLFSVSLQKWEYYRYEQEFRVLTLKYANGIEALKTHPDHLFIPVDLDKLIDRIYVPATATKTDIDFYADLLSSKGLKKAIYISGLNDLSLHT